MKQGGETNTIAVVDGVKKAIAELTDVPKQLTAKVVFDQSIFVKTAIETLLHEGAIGLVLTGAMVLLFLGSVRATAAVFLSIPLSALAAFLGIGAGGRHGQRNGAGRAGAGVFEADRQFGDRSRKYFPASRDGGGAGNCGGKGRAGSGAGGAGVDADDRDCFLSGDFSLWSEPVLICGAGCCRGCFVVRQEGKPLREAVAVASRLPPRPILMTSLATVLGLIPMAMKLGTGSGADAPLARGGFRSLPVAVV